jgi:hypothetical protein
MAVKVSETEYAQLATLERPGRPLLTSLLGVQAPHIVRGMRRNQSRRLVLEFARLF